MTARACRRWPRSLGLSGHDQRQHFIASPAWDDGPVWGNNRYLPGKDAWLVGEWRSSGERKSNLSDLQPDMSRRAPAGTIKARWVCEQAHQQLKEELGLDHFEGRSWTGLHRRALTTCVACAYLQKRRVRTRPA